LSTPYSFRYEMTPEGLRKRAAMKGIPAAQRYQLTRWLADTVRDAMRSAAGMQKAGKTHKTSQMGRNVGMDVQGDYGNYTGMVGTGVGGTQSVKYARIQDKGGTTHPRVTPKMRRFFWAKFHESKDDKFKWMALTKKQRLDVKIPESKWFSGVIDKRRALLDEMMRPAEVLRVAEKMGGN